MNTEAMDQIVNEHFMYEATDDIEGVLATFTDDIDHQAIGSPLGPLAGKKAVRPFYEALFDDLKGEESSRYAVGTATPSSSTSALDWPHQRCPLLRPPRPLGEGRFLLLHVFEFRDGLISREHVWSDRAAIAAQTEGAS